MLKTLNTKSAKSKKGVIGVGGNGRKEYGDKTKLDNRDDLGVNEVDGNEIENNDVVKEKNHQKISKSEKLFISKKTIESSDFFTFGIRLIFTKLRQIFIKA